MAMIYIRFEAPQRESQPLKDGGVKSLLKKALINGLTKVIPMANPDFEDKIDNVKYWLLELEIETGIPQKEVGIDASDKVIMVMPFKNNYGYWTDNNLLLKDFKELFNTSDISKEIFEQHWKILDKEE